MILPAQIPWVCPVESTFIGLGLSNDAMVDDVGVFGFVLLLFIVVGVLAVTFLLRVANNRSTGSDSSGTVSKLASDVSVSV